MKKIIITPPEGFEIDRENSTLEEIVFKEVQPQVKPFNLQEALNSAKFQCRDGSQILDWMYCSEFESLYRISAFVKDCDGDVNRCTWMDDGNYYTDDTVDGKDLVMYTPEEKTTFTKYSNVYVDIHGKVELGSHKFFDTGEEATQNIVHPPYELKFVATVSIEIPKL